jgi:hypothetical protein
MRKDHEVRIQGVFDNYARSWGPVEWRDSVAAMRTTRNDTYASLLHALGAIETDSVVMRARLHASRADRADPVAAFNILWLAEEAEHGRALRAAADKLGTPRPPSLRGRGRRDARALLTWPALVAAGFAMPHLEATYCTLGTIQEYIALTTYRRIGELLGDPALDTLLKAIARQESHHMGFYRKTAEILLDRPRAPRIVRLTIDRLWRAPGVDLLGFAQWVRTFGPLLRDETYRTRLLRADQLLADLAGPGRVAPMARCLDMVDPLLAEIGSDETVEGSVRTGLPARRPGGRRLQPAPGRRP